VFISLGIAGVIILISIAVIFAGVYRVLYNPASLFKHDFPAPGQVEKYFNRKIVNIVLIGMDPTKHQPFQEQGNRVDTIIVASINFDHNRVALISIPRDTYVEIAHLGLRDKISKAYYYGFTYGSKGSPKEGLRYTVDTASLVFGGARIPYYVAMDMDGLAQLVDALGGVEFDVDIMISGETADDDLYLGPQLLSGKGYLAYLTYREPDVADDLARIERQKRLMIATFDHFKRTGRLKGILHTYQAYKDHVITNLSLNQVAALLVFAGERIELDSISLRSLQGELLEHAGEPYLIPDERDLAALVKEVFGLELKADALPFTVPVEPQFKP
jgi:LCP family protein required for cell wall assembly